ncbi:uncharacterized protein FA14DRAFT_187097 [Meira miltonrushii]|uniref:Uncharacterized protein n=1 Tax=Meira miltonrushii TaxID=1280837 RepID=A0A316VKS6_9BASI|nr:uncharacterized protein FA14DRAFT_187097 [Meira miltonrushii]PWN36953.1 hypothetical protein FA14DRAFT_187097 [Meira miltonrushii]
MSYAMDDRTSLRGQAYTESNTSRSRSSFHTDHHHHSNRRPRSPLVPESFLPQSSTSQQSHFQQQQQSFAPRMRNGSNLTQPTSFEYNTRIPRASPLSVSAGRSATPNRSINDRQQLPGFGYSRSPHTPMTRFFVTVIPPNELASQADGSSSSRSTSFASSGHVKRGTLMPLYPTLGGQLYAISREYGLPSIGGLSIYLCDDGEGNLGPRVGEETWPYLWNRYFDDNSEDLYRDITNPSPSPSAMHIREASPFSNGHDRKFSAASGIDLRVDSNTERGTPVRDEEGLDDSMFHPLDPNASHRFQYSHLQNGSASYNGISPRQMMTPSPMRKGSARGYHPAQDASWRASPAASNLSSISSKLPIVGRIEWAVDKSRAPWWNQFIGATAAVQGSRAAYEAASGVPVPAGTARKHAQGRRSMHLPKRLNIPTESRTASTEGPMTTDSRRSEDRKSYDTVASDAQTRSNTSLFVPETSQGYAPLDEGDDEEEHNQYNGPRDIQRSVPGDESLDVDEELGGVSQDGRSYAGFSALMGFVNGSSSNYEARSTRDLDTGALEADHSDEEGKEFINEDVEHFNPHALEEMEDDRAWTGLQEQRASRSINDPKQKNAATFDALSASTLSTMNKNVSVGSKRESSQGRGSAVHDWIVKTHSPPSEKVEDDDHEGNAEEGSQASQDDVADVVGLWAAKASDPTGNIPLLPSIEERSFEPETTTVTSTRRSSANYSVKSRPDSRPDSRSASRTASRKDRESVISAHSRHSSKSTSRASRHSRHSSRRNFGHASRASQDMQFIVDPRSDGELQATNPLLQAGTGVDLQGSAASLLSPIALQENDEGTFGGPSPNLSSLLPPQTPDAMRQGSQNERDIQAPTEELKTRPYMMRQESLSAETPGVSSPTQLSPWQLDVPTPMRSPGQMSGSSSTSELSDTLMDMERALALLSPAGFGQQRSPNVQILPTREAVEEEGSAKLSAPKRMRFSSNVSASESMARARSLSASVTASPRWFRSPQSDQVPAMPRIISPSEASVAHHEDKRSVGTGEQHSDKGVRDDVSTLSSRPKSLSAATQKAVENVSSDDVAELAALSAKRSSSSTSEQASNYDAEEQSRLLKDDDTVHPMEATVHPLALSDVEAREEGHTKEVDHIETTQDAVQPHLVKEISTEHRSPAQPSQEPLEESYDSDSKDYAMRDEWISEQRKHISPTIPEKEEEENDEERNVELISQQVQPSDSIEEVAPTIVRPQYTTIGVQAEMPESDRSSSQFSLVSGNATSESYEAGTDEDGLHESVDRQLSTDDAHAEEHSSEGLNITSKASQTRERHSSETPRPLSQEKFETSKTEAETEAVGVKHDKGEESGQSTDYQQSAFARMIRGSVIESVSDAYSSKAVSPRIASTQEEDEDDEQLAWLRSRGGEGIMEEDANPFFHHHVIHREAGMNTDSPPQDDVTTTRGGNSTNRNSILSDDQWSQDDSASEGEQTDRIEISRSSMHMNEDEENEVGHDEDHELMLRSRLSGISGISSHRDALEASGGRTPTFLYDQHLSDIDHPNSDRVGSGHFGPSLSPMSAEHPLSVHRSPLQSTDSLTAGPTSSKDTSTGQHHSLNDSIQHGPSADALGIKFANPTARLPAPTLQELIRRHEIISLAGEPVHDESERMPNGFEEVYVQSPTRSYASGTTRSGTSDMIERPRYIETPLSSNELSGDASSATDQQKKDEKPIRRSMGSISDRRQDYRQNRRASLSAAGKATIMNGNGISSATTAAVKRNSPRLMVHDGSALPIRRSMSPLSPRYRFAALPPSPSLQANSKLMQSINNDQLSHSKSVPGNVNHMSTGSPPEFEPPQPAFSARSTSFGNGSVSPNILAARNALRQSSSAANSPRVRGSPLIIDTVKAQLGHWKRNKNSPSTAPAPEQNGLSPHDGPSSAPSYGIPAIPVYEANQYENMSDGTSAAIPANDLGHSEQQSNPAPFRGPAAGMKNSSTPPSPRGPRAQPFSIPSPINCTSSGVFSP